MISALIVNWNTRDFLADCLESLVNRTEPGDAVDEITVVDNASEDDSVEMVRDRYPGVTVISLDRNIGYAAGNNLAAQGARGDLMFFLNPDTVVEPGAVSALSNELAENPKTALVAPKLVLPDGATQASVRGFPTPMALFGAWTALDRLFPAHKVLASYRLPMFDYEKAQTAPQPMASAWMVRRSAWDAVGPFDERFPLFWNDVDWCVRAWEAGWDVTYLPTAVVRHEGGAGTRQIKPRATWESHRSLVEFYRRRYGKCLGPVRLALCIALIMGVGTIRTGWYRLTRRA